MSSAQVRHVGNIGDASVPVDLSSSVFFNDLFKTPATSDRQKIRLQPLSRMRSPASDYFSETIWECRIHVEVSKQ